MSPVIWLVTTASALLVAVIMSAIAWRVSREERRRSNARTAALADAIRAEPAAASVRAVASAHRAGPRSFMNDLPLRDGPAAASSPLFVPARTEPAGTRLVAIVLLGVFVVGVAAAVAIVFSGGSQVAPRTDGTRSTINGNAAEPRGLPPVELLSLDHERDGDRLTVRGTVKNPAAGRPIEHLAAIVTVFDKDGTFMATARAPVERAILGPGAESAFVVAVPAAGDVGRYRVSFRTDDRVVAHVDRRNRTDGPR
jgi:hypothetical protein